MTTGKATPFGSVSDFCTIRISLSLLSIFTADGNISLGGSTTTLHFALYVVSAKEAFIVGSDPIADPIPLFSGATAQQTGMPFGKASMNGSFVYAMTGMVPSGPLAGRPDTNLGLMIADGNGGFRLTGDENRGGQNQRST